MPTHNDDATPSRYHDEQVSFRLPPAILNEMRAIKKRDGVPLSEQIRRGMDLWLKTRRKQVGR